MDGKIVLKKFPEDYLTSSMLSCNDPANRQPFRDHAKALREQGHCPACAEATSIHLRPGEYWELGLDKDGEIIVAYLGAARSVMYILNYERFKNKQ